MSNDASADTTEASETEETAATTTTPTTKGPEGTGGTAARQTGRQGSPLGSEDELRELSEVLPAELHEAEAEARDLELRLERIKSDFESVRLRHAREADETLRFANERVLQQLIPVLDNFDRAHKAVEAAAQQGDAEALRLVDGLRAVARQIDEVLAGLGITAFSTMGQPFDPRRAEAVSMRPAPDVPAQTVLEEYQRGYSLHGRLLRPAMVIVSSGPDE